MKIFGILDTKTINTHLEHHYKNSIMQYPEIKDAKNIIESITYESGGEKIMYDVVFRTKSTYFISIHYYKKYILSWARMKFYRGYTSEIMKGNTKTYHFISF